MTETFRLHQQPNQIVPMQCRSDVGCGYSSTGARHGFLLYSAESSGSTAADRKRETDRERERETHTQSNPLGSWSAARYGNDDSRYHRQSHHPNLDTASKKTEQLHAEACICSFSEALSWYTSPSQVATK